MKYDDQTMVDYCLEQGWQIFYEEWTDAIGHLPCNSLGAMVYLVRDSDWRIRGYSQLSRKDAFRNAYEQAIQQNADKVQAVEIIKEVIDTSKARIKALEDVLRKLTDSGDGCYTGWRGIPGVVLSVPHCMYCGKEWDRFLNDGGHCDAHEPDCPIQIARELLGDTDES